MRTAFTPLVALAAVAATTHAHAAVGMQAAAAAIAASTAGVNAHGAASSTLAYQLDPSWPSLPANLNVSLITAVTVAVNNNATEVHVAQRGPSAPPVLVFSPITGQLLRTWGDNSTISSIHGMSTQVGSGSTPDTIWVTDVGDFTVKQFTQQGTLIQYSGTMGTAGGGIDPPQYEAPADVAVTAMGNVFVSDGDGSPNNRVLLLAQQGLSVIYGIGGNGTGPGQFSSPHSIALEVQPAFERVWVADRGNARLQAFDSGSGAFVGEWTCFTAPPYNGVPWGVRVDVPRGRMFVADGTTGQFFVLNLTASTQWALGPCQVLQAFNVCAACKPHELGLDETSGDVYLAGVGVPPTIQRYVPVQSASLKREEVSDGAAAIGELGSRDATTPLLGASHAPRLRASLPRSLHTQEGAGGTS